MESLVDEFCEKFFEGLLDFAPSQRAALRVAKRKHDDTKAVRKGSGQPYFIHPEAVAKLVSKFGGTDSEVKAAFLHDVREDCGADSEDLKEKFGSEVADIVDELTNDTYDIKKHGKEKYMDLKLEKLSHSALFVKLADILHNISDYPTESLKRRLGHNITYLTTHRDLDEREKHMVDLIFDVLRSSDYEKDDN